MDAVDTKLFHRFMAIAEMEATKIMREYGAYIRLYEKNDLIGWALVDGYWPDYTESDGVMRQVIRFDMLRSLNHALGYDSRQDRVLVHSVDMDRMPDIVDKDGSDPLQCAMIDEMVDLVVHTKVLTEEERIALLRRYVDGETYGETGKSMKTCRSTAHKYCKTGLNKIRRMVG